MFVFLTLPAELSYSVGFVGFVATVVIQSTGRVCTLHYSSYYLLTKLPHLHTSKKPTLKLFLLIFALFVFWFLRVTFRIVCCLFVWVAVGRASTSEVRLNVITERIYTITEFFNFLRMGHITHGFMTHQHTGCTF